VAFHTAYRPSGTCSPREGSTPLRLLVSDLDVNQSDIPQPDRAVFEKDLTQGGFPAGVWLLKLPYQGSSSMRKVSISIPDKLNRLLYLLATGKPDQVSSLLQDIQEIMAQKGHTQELSILRRQYMDCKNIDSSEFSRRQSPNTRERQAILCAYRTSLTRK